MAQLRQLEDFAGGLVNLTNNGPSKLSPKGISQFQLIVMNEFFESSIFSSLLYNVTNSATGYEYENLDELATILQTILAQEELHAINAIKYLNITTPSSHLHTSMNSDLQHSSTPSASRSRRWAREGNIDQVLIVAAMITNDAEQAGYLRHILEKKPSGQPFTTTFVAPFLLSVLNTFTIPSSCSFYYPALTSTTFSPFNIVGIGMIKRKGQTLTFETYLNGIAGATQYFNKTDGCGLYVTYVTLQLKPISMPANNFAVEQICRYNGCTFPIQRVFDGWTIVSCAHYER
ncbi:hypothetical protein TrVGV298_007196 [Trichoderma virens]|nr:hypothetical protein TrVGV298_007196 [Trichoderma virens]